MGKFRSAFYTPSWSGTRDIFVVRRESRPGQRGLAPRPGRCDGRADARQLLLGPSAGPRHSPLQRGWPAGCCPMSAMAGTGLGNKIETALREASSLLRTGTALAPPLHTRATERRRWMTFKIERGSDGAR